MLASQVMIVVGLAFDGLREIVEKIVIHPSGRYEPVELEIFGQLAAILKLC